MGWAPSFIDALRAPRVSLRWAVETFGTFTGDGVGRFPVVYSSHNVGVGQSILDPRSVRVGSHSVSLSDWTYRRQSWSFRLVGVGGSAGSVSETLRPGTLVRLRCDAVGNPYGIGWEVLQVGVVADVRWQAGDVAVTVYDLLTGLRQRFAKQAPDLSLFPNAGTSTTLTSGYTAGVSTTLEVNSTTGFDELSGALTDIVLVTPTGGTPFFLTYTGTGTGPTRLSGVSTTGQRGTTAVNAATGSTVTQYAHMTTRPDQILARILTSTGTTSANSVYDVLPDDWAFGLTNDTTIDTHDMVATWGNTIMGSVSGGWDIDIAESAEQTDGLAWLQGVLAAFAMWPVNRQGRVSMRMPQDPAALLVGPAATIRDSDIARGAMPEVEWYHPDRRAEYFHSSVTSDTGTSFDTGPAAGLSSYPATAARTYDVSAYVFANEANIRADLAARTAPWDTCIPERVTLPLQSCAWARLVPGDVVRLNLPGIAGRFQVRGRLVSTEQGYNGRLGMVDEVSTDWQAGTTTVSVAIAPTSASDNRQ